MGEQSPRSLFPPARSTFRDISAVWAEARDPDPDSCHSRFELLCRDLGYYDRCYTCTFVVHVDSGDDLRSRDLDRDVVKTVKVESIVDCSRRLDFKIGCFGQTEAADQ